MADKPPDRPWHPSEKTFLLAEVIKNSTLPPQRLIEIINSHVPPHDLPRLESLSLPTARSFDACRNAIYELLPYYPHYPTQSQPQHQQVQMLQQQQQPYMQQQQHQQQYQQPQQPQHYHHHRNSAPQTPVQASANANYMRQQPFQLHQNNPVYSTGKDLRPLRPKDSTPKLDNDASPGGGGPPPKKKRGRPTKAEAQAKADAAAQAGTEAGPSTRPVSAQTHTAAILEPRQSIATPTTIDTIRTVAPLPDTSRITIDAITTPAAIVAVERRDSPPSHSSSGSSGRRRRNRLRQQTGAEEAAATGSPRTRSARVSPSAVLLVTTIPDILEETPARAAMVRQYAVDETRSPGRSNSAAPPDGRPHRSQDPSRL